MTKVSINHFLYVAVHECYQPVNFIQEEVPADIESTDTFSMIKRPRSRATLFFAN